MNQQIDMDGNLHDLAPRCEQDRLFTADPQIRGQLNIDTDRPVDWADRAPVCSECGEPFRAYLDPPPLAYCQRCGEVTFHTRIDTDRAAQATVGKYRIEPPPEPPPDRPGHTGIAYVLVSPRGKRYGLLRNEPDPHMMFAIHMDRFGCAEHVGWFTDKDGTLKEAR
jgi:hypothetical protein